MKLTFLGTGAVGYPLAFCNCDNCQIARKHQGKSIRKRASVLINDDLLIDIGPDTQTAMMLYGKDMGKIGYILQTHVHVDHYDIGLLASRIPYEVDKKTRRIELCAHKKCIKIMSERIAYYEKADLISKKGQDKLNINANYMKHGDVLKKGNYTIKAIESKHAVDQGSLLYVITENDKVIFYATDTPKLSRKALKDLSEYKIDVMVLDHTLGNVPYSTSHLNTSLFIETINELKDLGIIDNKTKIYATHISHDGNPYHEAFEEAAIKNGYLVAYDGLELDI